MSLQARFESLDRPGFVIRYPMVVEKGQVGFWENKAAGFVIAQCSNFDMGGVVFETEDPEVTAKGTAVFSWSEENFAGHILPGLDFRLPIVEADDEQGILIIQHEMPGGIRNSLS
jgi:hypothetical protein